MKNDICKKNNRVIAFYLPQFYPTPENDVWWEPGFTEWTNVVRAKPLFKGHYQPRIPRDLSFYDLRVSETRDRQAEFAREAGIEGFCYWHYWFGSGKRLLDRVFSDVLTCGKPDFPFCLCWANHSWYQKTWKPNTSGKLLIEQTYQGIVDYKAHFQEMLPAFKDKRYIRTFDGKLLFGIFDPDNFTDFKSFKDVWNTLAIENHLKGFEFFAYTQGKEQLKRTKEYNEYDQIVYDPMKDTFFNDTVRQSLFSWIQLHIKAKIQKPIKMIDYSQYVERTIKIFRENSYTIPCIVPMFDHSPRSKGLGYILNHNNPQQWGILCQEIRKNVEKSDKPDRFIFIKAWNEWGEGNYMEPDARFGKAYIEESHKAFND